MRSDYPLSGYVYMYTIIMENTHKSTNKHIKALAYTALVICSPASSSADELARWNEPNRE